MSPSTEAPATLPRLLLGVALLIAGVLCFVAARRFGRSDAPEQRHEGPVEYLDLAEMCAVLAKQDPKLGTDALDRLEARPSPRPFQVELRLADMYLRHGRNDEALALLEELRTREAGDHEHVQRIRRALGIAHMRAGETANCVHGATRDRCLFPIRAGGVWSIPDEAIAAQREFEAYLEDEPDAPDVRWLLNLVHMTAGTYPDGVPARWLLAPELFASDTSIGTFPNVARELGVDTLSGAGGGIMDDFDGDGWLDLVASSCLPCDPLRYYHNNGDGTFDDWSARAGLLDQVGGLNCMHADYDGDGRLDLLVLRGGWQGPRFGRQRNSLLHQNDDGTFTDVTFEAGLASPAYPTQAAGWCDFDGDGDLDLFVGNEQFPGQLFRNNGDGTFTDIADAAGVAGAGEYVKGVAWGDFDNDGAPDLYVSSFDSANRLYRNEGDGAFVDVATDAGVAIGSRARTDESVSASSDATGDDSADFMSDASGGAGAERTFASWFWDFDNDGWLDLFVGGFDAKLDGVASDYAGDAANGERLRIYRNLGNGRFDEVAAQLGVADVRLPMGANFGDVNGDGFLDFYLGTGRPKYEFLVPNTLYLSDGGARFQDATTDAHVGHLQKGHGIAFGDLDGDGDLDMFAQMGGFYPADAFHDALFANPGNANAWTTILLRGTVSNRFGLDARVRVVVRTPSGERTIHRRVTSGGSFGGSSFQQEIGLGDATEILRIEVDWPHDRGTQVVERPPLGRFLEIVEGQAGCTPLERRAMPAIDSL